MRRSLWASIALIIVLIGAMLPPSPADSAQGEMGRSLLEELITGADCVVVGTVAECASYWNDERTGIYTSVVLAVEERWKGTVSQDRITVTAPGGEVDGMWQWVSHTASFEKGERAVVLLKRIAEEQRPGSKRARLQVPGEQFEVYGGFRGKFTVVADSVGDLSLVQFEERVISLLEGRASALCELEDSLSVAISAYSYSGFSWPHPPAPAVSYRINENTSDCTGEGAAVQAAAATWSAAGANFAFSYAGTTTATGYSYNGVNEILWRNLGSGGPVAHAIWWGYSHSGEIMEADIEFNDYYLWSTATPTPSGRYDVQTVALHELGHWLSLNDLYNAADSAKVMYGYVSTGTTKRVLHADDIAGIRHIYGTAPVLPDAPSELAASAISSSRIDLTWQDNSDNESGFSIERRTGSGLYSQVATVGAGVTSYSDTSLSGDTTYYYRVKAYNTAGDSAYSNEASATTLPPSPAAPILKSPASGSTVSSRTPRLEWNASTGATEYGLQVATSSTFTNLLVNESGITDLFYDIPEGILNWNTTYYWRVNAANSYESTSNWSDYRDFETATGPPPDAPSELTASAISSSRIDLTWQDNSDNESGFSIESKTSTGSYSQIATVGAGVNSYSDTSLSADTTYYYRVKAYNTAGDSAYSNEASATTLPPPPAAPILKSPASGSTVSSRTPRLEWNASTGATEYGLQVATSSTFTNLLVNESGITDFFYDIPEGILNWSTTYYWQIVANNHGLETEGPVWSFTTVSEDNDVEPPDDEPVDNPPIEEAMSSICGELVIVLLWQPATQNWDMYFPLTGDDSIGTLEVNRAYFIYVDAACTLEYGAVSIPLYAGWNNPPWPAQ